MNLAELGTEYLQDAANIREHLTTLRAELELLAGKENRILKWRVATLYKMYLECRTMGEFLRRHPSVR